MRRFSQRNSLVTLSDINITPLLDLAFVLLIIFVIISPSIRSKHENGMQLNLPEGGGAETQVDARDIRLVEISAQGEYMLDRRRIGVGTAAAERLIRDLVAAKKTNPNLVVRIRSDRKGLNEHLYAVVNGCLQHNITRFSWATAAANSK